MASDGDQYLPNLTRVFAGEANVFSWYQALRDLRSTENQSEIQSVKSVLRSSPNVESVLSQQPPLFQAPSPQSKTLYETKTAAINVTPSSNSSYDITQIKTDVTWLSAELKIAEDEALRIVILEWVQRPQQQLVAGFSDVEHASLRDALGPQSTLSGDSFKHLFPRRQDTEFDTDLQRRRRIVTIYTREQAGVIGIACELQLAATSQDVKGNRQMSMQGPAATVDPSRVSDTEFSSILDNIDARLELIGAGKSWLSDGEAIEDLWLSSHFQIILQLAELLLLRVRSAQQLTMTGDVVLQWFLIAAKSNFFASIYPADLVPVELMQCLQSVASTLSVALLSPASVVGMLVDDSTNLESESYVLNSNIVNELTQILTTASESGIAQAGPASLCWALILEEVRNAGLAARDSREAQTSQKVLDSGKTTEPSSSSSSSARRVSYGSLQQSIFEDVVDQVLAAGTVSDAISYLLRCSIEVNNAFDIVSSLANFQHNDQSSKRDVKLHVLQEVVTLSFSILGYSPDVIESQFAILGVRDTADTDTKTPDIRNTFIESDFLMTAVFSVAAGRFPHESLPFLRLCRLLAPVSVYDEDGLHYITAKLRAMDSYTQLATGRFSSYQTVREDENLNLVALESGALMIDHSVAGRREVAYSTSLPVGTIGEVISESTPPVVRWQHSFSAIVLIGVWLEQFRIGKSDSLTTSGESPDEIVAECIGIFSSLLRNAFSENTSVKDSANGEHKLDELIAEMGSGLHLNDDIADCIFDIMEQQLQAFRRKPSNTFDTAILIACVEFMSILIQLKPEKSWALFSRTTLLESFASDSFLLSIVTGIESPNKNFPFLSTCCGLYREMIKAAVPTMMPSASNARISSYQKPPLPPQTIRLQATLLQSLTQSMFVLYDRLPGWTFASRVQMCDIVTSLSDSFAAIAFHAHGIGSSISKFNTPFRPACQYLEEQLRKPLEDRSGLTAPLQCVFMVVTMDKEAWSFVNVETTQGPVSSCLRLAHRFIRLGKIQSASISNLELQFFNSLPVLVRVMANDIASTPSIYSFTEDLLVAVQNAQPVSLLGHLGSISALCFIEVLRLGLLTSRVDAKIHIWKLLAHLVGQSQRWLALILLTGAPPDTGSDRQPDTVKHQKTLQTRGQSMIETAIEYLIKINDLEGPLAIAILEFVLNAQQNWSWVSSTLKVKKELFPALISYMRDTFVDRSSLLKVSLKNNITALVTDLATTQLHYAKATHEKDTIKVLMSLLFFFADDETCVQVGSYNSSLHANLRRNVADRYMGLDISELRRTKLLQTTLGDDFYYDTSYVQRVICGSGHHEAALRNRQGQAFVAEFYRANLNLSVVESELILLRSVKHFCVEHGAFFVHDSPIATSVRPSDLSPAKNIYGAFTSIIRNCLSANMSTYPALEIFENLFQSRSDLVNTLLQKLADVHAKGFEIKGLLKMAWESARHRNLSYEQAILNDDLIYWRSSLTTILLTLQFHCGGKWSPPAYNHEASDMLRQELTNITPTVLELMTVVVGSGFCTVATSIQQERNLSQSSPEHSGPSVKDLLLILSLFNTMLHVTRAPEFVSEASERLRSSEIIESCILLYSWSHTFRNGYDNDPVYADLCLQYLGTLSSLTPLAEYMGIEGVLSRLLSAQVTQRLQNVPHGAGPLDSRPGCRFLYGLWVSGLLPICLNLLHSIGAPVAAEVSLFLNQFPQQLSRASTAFVQAAQSREGVQGSITLMSGRETALLALLSYILDSYRSAGASVAVDPSTITYLAEYDEHKKALIEDIQDVESAGAIGKVVATNNEEVEWSKTKDEDRTKLEQKVILHLKSALICLRGQNVGSDDV